MPTPDRAVAEGYAPFHDHRTWYEITGDLSASRLPLVVVHGGPGLTHDYLDAFRRVAAGGRAVIHYDQIGNGRSSRLPEEGREFWTVALFLAELDNLLKHLGIGKRYALLGQSWGGIIAAEHAAKRPEGLKALVLANAYASMDLFIAGAKHLRAQLPADVRETLDRHERAGTTDDAPYQAALGEFIARHVCRVRPLPPELVRSLAAMAEDPTVFHAMYGPSLFQLEGTLRSWSAIDRLDRIAAPTLVFRGAHDEASEAAVRPFADRIPDIRSHVFEASSHLPHIEEPEACLSLVRRFLERCDGESSG